MRIIRKNISINLNITIHIEQGVCMDKKKIEYIIIAIAIFLLLYVSYFSFTYHYAEHEVALDSITLISPNSSEYAIEGNTIVFKNSMYDIYNLNVTKVNSSDKKVTNLINYYSNFKQGKGITYKNESYYLLSVVYDVDGYNCHSILIPIDSFNKEELSFTNETTVWIYSGNNREFVMDSAVKTERVA